MFYMLGLFLFGVGVLFLALGSRLYGQPKVGEQISVWRTLIPTLNEPAERFYRKIYQALKASLEDRLPDGDNLPGGNSPGGNSPVEIVLTGMGFGPHRLFARHSLFAERPLYLLIKYQHLKCYVYAGQSPAGLYVSSWGYSDYHVGEGANQRLVSNKKAWKYFSHQTLFQFDAAIMFTTAVHEILSGVVDEYREEEGLQPLESLERRPVLHAFYQNPFYRDQPTPQNHPYQSPQSQVTGTQLSVAPSPVASSPNAPTPNVATPNFHPAAAAPAPLFAMDAAPEPANPEPEGVA